MVRPTGIELVSSAPQADTLSIELWALKSDLLRQFSYYLIILTFLFLHFNQIYRPGVSRREYILSIPFWAEYFPALNCYNNSMKEEKTGTYVYDKKLGKMVKVSDRIPSVKKSGGSCCGGCCGHCGCHDD